MSEKQFKACIYARLSREDGDKAESDSISSQRAMIREYLSRQDDIEIVAEKVDDGYSGVSFDRPAFNEMMELIRDGSVNCVVVKDLSRFGRNYIEAGNYIERVFPFMGVRFIAINDHYDSAEEQNSSTSLVIPFKNLINDAYCKDISVKIRTQLDIKRKKGQYLSAFAVYGYLKDPEDHNHLIPDPYASEVVRKIYQWTMEGNSLQKIADDLNSRGVLCPMEYKESLGMKIQTIFRTGSKAQWGPSSVRRILTNEIYVGHLIQGKAGTPNYKVRKIVQKDASRWIRVEDTHQAIISPNVFRVVQDLLARDLRISPDQDRAYLLSGFLECADCGQSMVRRTVTSGKKKYAYYVCGTNKARKGCSSHNISEEKLIRIVTDSLRCLVQHVVIAAEFLQRVDSLPEKDAEVTNVDTQIVHLTEEIEQNTNYMEKLYENLSEGMINKDEYFQFKKTFQERISKAKQAVSLLQKERQAVLDGKRRDMEWIRIFQKYDGFKELDRKMVAEIISRIIVHKDGTIEIITKFQDELRALEKYYPDAFGNDDENRMEG